MALYLLHSTVRLGGIGRSGAQHYLGWTTPQELRYRVNEHRHANAHCAITNAFHAAGAELILVYVRWDGGRAEEKYLKANGHVSDFCPICHPEIRRLQVPNEWYLPLDGTQTLSGPWPKPESESGGVSSPGSAIGNVGWSPRARHRVSTTGSRWPRRVHSTSGGTPSSATAQQPPKEGT